MKQAKEAQNNPDYHTVAYTTVRMKQQETTKEKRELGALLTTTVNPYWEPRNVVAATAMVAFLHGFSNLTQFRPFCTLILFLKPEFWPQKRASVPLLSS